MASKKSSKANGDHSSSARKRSTSKKSMGPASSLLSLQRLAKEQTKQYTKANRTTENYDAYVRRGKQWLAGLLMDEKGAEEQWKSGAGEGLSGEGEDDEIDPNKNLMADPEFRNAFDGLPGKCTPQAIAMFLAYKCFEENNKKSTADGIHTAFISEYDHMDGDTYRGRWHYDKDQDGWYGNPARSADVDDIMVAIKHKNGAEGEERHHSLAMSKQYMDKLFEWSMKVCPNERPESLPEGLEDLKQMTEHLRFRAFSSLGWTIWARNSETAQLQRKNLEFSPESRDGGSPGDPDFFVLSLEFRKNWQKRLNKNQLLRGHRYKIYGQPNMFSVDAHRHLLNWLHFCELLLGRPLEPDDYIFPSFSFRGAVEPHRHISQEIIQKSITEFAIAAGIPGAKSFTTHCFRRGEAQYRFMFAPIGEQWTLSRIRWWGGWADGEHRDTLIKYLLDELYSYEEDHSDALCPISREADASHLGEASLVRPLGTDEARLMLAAQNALMTAAVRETIALAFSNASPFTGISQAAPTAISMAHALPQQHPGIAFSRDHQGCIVPIQTTQPPCPNSTQFPKHVHPRPAPVPSCVIPSVPRGELGWKQVVRDWEFADPSRSLPLALKDWPQDWYSGTDGASRALAMHYHHRKSIATEFIKTYHRDEKGFEEAFPECGQGITMLRDAVLTARQLRGDALTRKSKRRRVE